MRVAAAKQEANVRHGSVVGAAGQRYGVVVGRFNDLVTKLLLEGAYGAFTAHGVPLSNVEVRRSQTRWVKERSCNACMHARTGRLRAVLLMRPAHGNAAHPGPAGGQASAVQAGAVVDACWPRLRL